jgi:signal transduction histidine kinase
MDALTALDEATRAIASVLSTDEVLQVIVERVRDLVDARYAALGIIDANGRIERFITVGITPEQRARLGDPPQGHGLLGTIIREGRTLRIPDIAAHPDSYGFPPEHPPMHSLLGVPVRVKGGRIVGNLYLTDKRNAPAFSEDDQALVEMFALHAGIAIDNARLHEQVQRLVVAAERERIGRDLHDGIIQRIYGVSLSLEDVPELMAESPTEAEARVDRAIDTLHDTIRDIRTFIVGLHPGQIAGDDLPAAVHALAEELRSNTLLAVDVAIGPSLTEPDERVRNELLQMVREGLSNVARHAHASHATLDLATGGDDVVLAISEDGAGFDPDDRPTDGRQGGHGINNMRSRVAALGGSFDIDSAPGRGTRITIRVPAKPQESIR